jgi:F-type H+-transporting ATPase subunit a
MIFNLIATPLDQFEIRDLISIGAPLFADIHISLTTISFYLIICFFVILNFNLISNNLNRLVPNG